MAIESVDLPNYTMVTFHSYLSYLSLPEGILYEWPGIYAIYLDVPMQPLVY